MPFHKSSSKSTTEIEKLAESWGKVVARRVHEEFGPDLDLNADDIEQMGIAAACIVARGDDRRPPRKESKARDPKRGRNKSYDHG